MATHGNRSASTSTVSNATLATRLLVSVAWILLVVISGISPRLMQHGVCQGVRGHRATDTCAGFRQMCEVNLNNFRHARWPGLRRILAGDFPMIANTVAMLLALAALSGCAAPAPGTMAPQTAAPEVAAPASAEGARVDRTVTLPSGATLKVAADWTVTTSTDGLILEDPEKQLKIELVEVEATAGMSAAISTAWSRRHPGFNRQELAASDSPGREGWDLFRWSRYETSPDEARRVSALAARKGSLAVVALFDGALAAAQRRSAQNTLVQESVRPAGYVRETYRGRTPRVLDAARIAQLKTFVDRMRDAADVPGLSVALFDRHGTLLEEGFGVRERGRDERVTADTLYMIASNTKALTTLMLARLVDEGRFEWDTPVRHGYPAFKIGDAAITRRILMTHLVCACTGLPRQDFEWLFTFHRSSPQDQLDVLATMRPTTAFGALYQYSNPLASAAGYVGARAVRRDGELGQAYDDVRREKVFGPLGMGRTTFSFDEAFRTDHASPHSWDITLRNVPIDMALNYSIVPVDRKSTRLNSSHVAISYAVFCLKKK